MDILVRVENDSPHLSLVLDTVVPESDQRTDEDRDRDMVALVLQVTFYSEELWQILSLSSTVEITVVGLILTAVCLSCSSPPIS